MVALAAQESEHEICPQCLASVLPGQVRCDDPTCPMLERELAGMGDQQVYPQLAKANLLRMRGEIGEARNECLAILKRQPGNFTAHVLLGDLAAESGSFDQAIQWYELALDLLPGNPQVTSKLEQVRQRIEHKQAAEAVAQLGIPTTKPKMRAFLLISAAFVAVVGIGGFLAGRALQRAPKVTTVSEPIVAKPIAAAISTPAPTPKIEPDKPAPAPVVSAPVIPKPAGDQAVLDLAKQKCKEGARVLDAQQDVRTKNVMLTARATTAEPLADIAAILAQSALAEIPDCPRVTVRLVEQSKILFVADMMHDDVAAAAPADLEKPSSLLRNVWPATP